MPWLPPVRIESLIATWSKGTVKPKINAVVERQKKFKKSSAKSFINNSLVALALFCVTSIARADLVYPGGICGHDIDGFELCAVDLASVNANPGVNTVNYTYDSNAGYGHLQFTGTTSNARFRPDAIDGAQFGTFFDPYGAGVPVIGSDAFTFDFYLDASGEFVTGPGTSSVSVNGMIVADSILGVGVVAAVSDLGQTLNGALTYGNIFDAGGVDNGDGTANFDFRYYINALSLLTEFDMDDSVGQLSVFNIAYSNDSGNLFTSDWTSFNNTANVYVPVPSAIWLMISGLFGLGIARLRK